MRFVGWWASVAGLLLLALGIFLTQTPWGTELVLKEVLRRAQGSVHGEIVVEGVSSQGLLRGFVFRGVRILGEDGRPFLEADSLMAGLSPGPLVRGDLVFTRVAIWSPRIRLERLPGRDQLNVVSIFAGGPGEDSGEGVERTPSPPEEAESPAAEDSLVASGEAARPPRRGRTVAFRGLRIQDGSLDVLLPVPPGGGSGEEALTEPAPDGTSTLRRFSFTDIQLDISEGVVLSPRLEGERIRVEALAFQGQIRPAPFRVEDLSGEVRREGSHLLLTLETLRLPDSQAQGTVVVSWGGISGTHVVVQGESDGLALHDLRWIEPRLPDGVVRGPLAVETGPDGVLLRFQETRLGLSPGNLRASGSLLLGSPLRLGDLDLALTDVDPVILDPWMPRPLPLSGLVAGELRLNGGPSSLEVDGDLTLFRPGSPDTTSAVVTGILHLGDTLGVTDFAATVAPFDWSTLESISPRMTLSGPGALRVDADGSLLAGITIDAEATHVPSGMSPSHLTARGTLQRAGDDLLLNLGGELSPLSLTTLRRFLPGLPLTGEVSGPVSVRGYLSDLTLEAELLTSAGPLGFEAHFDARDPTSGYSVDSDFQEFLLSSLLPSAPEPTRITGRLLASGRGATLDSLEGNLEVYVRRGDLGTVRVDTAALVARVGGGTLQLDAAMAETSLGRVRAEGDLALLASAPPGELDLEVESESLQGLRPFLMGEVPVVMEDLTDFERGLLVLEGADLDTIPTAAEVAVEGRVRGQARLRGGLESFSGEGNVSLRELRYRADYLRAGELTFSAQDFPGDGRRIQGLFQVDSLAVRDLVFRGGEVEADVGKGTGRVRLLAQRGEGEEYRARGTFALDTLGGTVNLDELIVRFDTIRWNLGGPTSFAWSPQGVQVRDFQLIRPGMGHMRIQADGFLPFHGEGEFNLEVQKLNVGRLARMAQMEDSLQGVLDFRVRLGGTAEDPTLEGRFSGDSLRYGPFTMAGVDAEFTYGDQLLRGEAWASEGGRQVLAMEGSFPADLRLRPEGSRIPQGPVDLTIAVDSFPAPLALVVVEALEEVKGGLSGQVHLGGTPDELAPDGTVDLTNGSVLLPALGVRYQDVEAAFVLNPDGTVDVDGTLRSEGNARVTGTVTLHPISDPPLDLTVDATNLLAVQRRDVQARISGEIHVLQSYRRPRVEGSLTVERGVLMVEELARSAEVVDLSDPRFIDVVEDEATLRPVVQASQNPFLQNLMLAVDVSMARDSWLRGQDLNVEMDGELQVFWDRTERNLAMVGELEAVRGVYTVLGRQFQVREGTVSFIGTPGVDPNLDIQAMHRVRTPEENLEITANVGGTLLSPRVSLTSNAAYGIAESDLVSYLIFGRPSYALASGQNRYVQGAAGSLLGAAGGAGLNFTLGTVGSQLSSVVARDFGLDYLAISQGEYADPLAANAAWYGTVSTTQVEIGQYLTQDVFAAIMWRPLTSLGTAQQDQFAGLRLEWRLADFWTLDGFIEDRFARSPLFRSADFKSKKVLGLSFWREWGY